MDSKKETDRIKYLLTVSYLLLILFIQLDIAKAGNVVSGVTIQNSPPMLVAAIPNQTWVTDRNYTNAFDLDEYFQDPNGDALNYSFFGNSRIAIEINSSTHNVSFFQPSGFIGVDYVVFIANDSYFAAYSNNVTLNVTADSTPPIWFNPQTSKTTVYSGDTLHFTATWQDDSSLANYTFSINQSGNWVNYSSIVFIGTESTSTFTIQIIATATTVVQWQFYACDKSGNCNATSVQEFTVISSPPLPPSPSLPPSEGGGGGGGGISYLKAVIGEAFAKPQKIKNFTVEPKSMRVPLKQGETRTKILKIYNSGSEEISFSTVLINIGNFVVLSEKSFVVKPGETKVLTLDFAARESEVPDLYFGSILINAGNLSEGVKVVIEVNPLKLSFDLKLRVQDKYKSVRTGDSVTADIIIKSLEDIKTIETILYTAIKDLNGEIIDSSQETFLLTDVILMNKTLEIPIDAKLGEYVFYSRLTYNRSVAISSDIFEVGERMRLASFIRLNIGFLLLFLLILFTAIIALRYRWLKRKARILNLYLMINELRKLVEKKEFEKATKLYIRLKASYGEPLTQEILEDKDKLKEEIIKLTKELRREHTPSQIFEKGKEIMRGEGEKKEDKIKKAEEQRDEKAEAKAEEEKRKQ